MKMISSVGRRDFLKVGGGLLAAAKANARSSATATPQPYGFNWYPFTQHPDSDTCWSLSTGPDGRIYASACAEGVPGGTVKVMRYNEQTDALDLLFDLGDMVGDPGNSGRATQCKIHYSFAPSMHDGILYMATHLSGPPIDLPVYNPWYSWHDPKRVFRGAALLAFNTRNDQVSWSDTLIPKEGCRCLLFDEDRGLLYALSYPRDHLIMYDVETRKRRDLGRIGSINGQVLLLDAKHRVLTANDYGHLVRYSPDKGRIEVSPEPLPYHRSYQTGWHSVLYDAAPTPDGQSVFGVQLMPNPLLMRIWLNEGEWPRVENLGPVTQDRDKSFPINMFIDHCGGLTFAGDGKLYFVASRWRDPERNPMPSAKKDKEGVIIRVDPVTLKREEVGLLDHPKGTGQYVSRGAVDHNGDLFFGHIGFRPAGIFKVNMPADRKRENAHLPLRKWG